MAQLDGRLAEEILIAAWSTIVPAFPTGRLAENDGVLLAMTGAPHPQYNPGLIVSEPRHPSAALQWGITERGALGSGYDIPVGRYPTVEDALADIGHVHLFARPAMVAAVADIAVRPSPQGLQIERVAAQEGIDEVTHIQASAFNADPDVEAALMRRSLVTAKDSYLALGRVDNVAVACAFATRSPAGVGVFGVATHPSAQGRGYGSAVTAHAARGIAQAGDLAALQSSEAGFSVYQAMGFVDVGPWAVWVSAAEKALTH